MDASEAMLETDLLPNRWSYVSTVLDGFILEFFDQNPLSQLALIMTQNEHAKVITEFSSNPNHHRPPWSVQVQGAPSFQNVLQLAQGLLHPVPSHGTKEVVLIHGALTSWDPSNVETTFARCVQDHIRVSILSVSAEVYMCRQWCEKSLGVFAVALNEVHFKELILEHLSPPPMYLKGTTPSNLGDLMQMGFPERITEEVPFLCACHTALRTEGFECPRCASRVCSVPTECNTCGLALVLASHLARSYHHLFPVPNFIEINDWDQIASSTCHGCMMVLPTPPSHEELLLSITKPTALGRYMCPTCHHQFCIDCDVFVHEVLHNCPTCI
ncbi:hypothetical protein HMI54_002300 [Coelomomyces lativittatus]|nr:hypothetical protein HMI54_002300 [Coelomomyces lativittatus]